jgi:hypothetical protein
MLGVDVGRTSPHGLKPKRPILTTEKPIMHISKLSHLFLGVYINVFLTAQIAWYQIRNGRIIMTDHSEKRRSDCDVLTTIIPVFPWMD